MPTTGSPHGALARVARLLSPASQISPCGSDGCGLQKLSASTGATFRFWSRAMDPRRIFPLVAAPSPSISLPKRNVPRRDGPTSAPLMRLSPATTLGGGSIPLALPPGSAPAGQLMLPGFLQSRWHSLDVLVLPPTFSVSIALRPASCGQPLSPAIPRRCGQHFGDQVLVPALLPQRGSISWFSHGDVFGCHRFGKATLAQVYEHA
jgi:hypothetical protein